MRSCLEQYFGSPPVHSEGSLLTPCYKPSLVFKRLSSPGGPTMGSRTHNVKTHGEGRDLREIEIGYDLTGVGLPFSSTATYTTSASVTFTFRPSARRSASTSTWTVIDVVPTLAVRV